MHKISSLLLFAVCLLSLSEQNHLALAAESAEQPPTPKTSLTVQQLPPAVLSKLEQALASVGFLQTLPSNAKITHASGSDGLYSIQVGIYLFDISSDGHFSMQGTVLERAAEMQGAAEVQVEASQEYADIVRETLAALDERQMVVFAPAGKVLHTITVFTDVSCPYSIELHREIELLNDDGVKVRYLGYPRMGHDSLGYQQMRPIWCSDNRAEAFDLAMNHQRVPLKNCDSNALDNHIKLGDSLGLMGTPTLLFDDGSVFTGYSNAIDIISYLERGTELPPSSFSWVADFADEIEAAEPATAVEYLQAQAVAIDTIPTPVRTALYKHLHELWFKPVPWEQLRFTASHDFFSTKIGAYRIDVSNDGKFVMKMNLLENIAQFTEGQRALIRQQALAVFDEQSAITFTPDSPAQYRITLFTDANCQFCQSQYREIPYLLQAGVEIRYLAYPTGGLDAPEYQTLSAIWCAKDRKQALLAEKPAKKLRLATKCQNPVAVHYEFGRSLGIQSAPATVLENGELLPGYSSSDEILDRLEHKP